MLPFVALDALSATLLVRMAEAQRAEHARVPPARSRDAPLDERADGSQLCETRTAPVRPGVCALLFLWNPCTVAACVGCAPALLVSRNFANRRRRNNWSALETCAVLAGA